MVETFVEQNRFTGASYRATNWIHVGTTAGRGRQDSQHLDALPPKEMYISSPSKVAGTAWWLNRHKFPIEKKESNKWLISFKAATATAAAYPDTTIVSVGDREADIYEIFALANQTQNAPLRLVRAHHDRKLLEEQGRLLPVGGRFSDTRKIRKPSASRVMKGTIRYLEDELELPVNKEKSKVSMIKDATFLGFQMLRGKIRISGKARTKFKVKIRNLTKRNNPLSMYQLIQLLNEYLRGWVITQRVEGTPQGGLSEASDNPPYLK